MDNYQRDHILNYFNIKQTCILNGQSQDLNQQ